MGRKAIEIIDLDVEMLIEKLNMALAEEWLAYYQYWIGARLMEGPMRNEVEAELLIHANEELGHAVLVADRIIQLGGTPITHPQKWMEKAGCSYEEPLDPYVEVILNQNLEGERCAIARYNEIAEITNGRDHATHQMATQILNDELEHEEDIEAFIADIQRLKDDIRKIRLEV
ncbi:bacterioferritin [Dethiosulfatibacter aminovorans DSM 17477]|uniref:Bacterioferritin n=1 Tax=Dethiosulfatibacter aminovorans DSM 17477 TaxID=1121476 RepID=A0A1M6E9D7_9FIRM|nr:ferritin-like domain-containing protein [Dethiosulfatibacter aminovorans]SHI81979.1 bacterioferritin [Dethiosulfatibacter aminovorans DSM 17477]